MTIYHPGSASSYVDVEVSGVDGVETYLDGLYDGFCIDADLTIVPGTKYTVDVLSSLVDLFASEVIAVDNMDLVNWIINQNFTDAEVWESGCEDKDYYTSGDIQFAIWSLIDDNTSTGGLGEFSECAANEIIALAEDHKGFLPGCGENLAIVLRPTGNQPIIIWKEVPCGCGEDETAWGMGNEFNDADWSMYFIASCN